ncbi:hypothetical protein GC105_16540 [Alkalibaculum sp. M08DMB]|uniref:TVP38/TMEM64 family membrane protein n=1 Tax=Alkalibaculum sporogenes TaxID=2655001 RepID=A0A6A7KDC8_9FIRM|nr:VTT domain-containing protein [Alkalibaculum sporogenes]MPW27365.1 hypothetical protein [Alkalibaculum sporogenes]
MSNSNIFTKIKKNYLQGIPLLIMLFFIIIFLIFEERTSIIDILEDIVIKNYFQTSILLIIMYAIKSLTIFLPITILYLFAGMVYSPFTAILVNIIGTSISITIPYWMGRYYGTSLTQKLFKKYHKIQQFHELQKNNDWFFCYLLRVIAILPYDIVSMYIGSIKISYITYLSGSLIGILPNILIMTLVGINITDPNSPLFISAISFKVILVICSIIIYRIVLKFKRSVNISKIR